MFQRPGAGGAEQGARDQSRLVQCPGVPHGNAGMGQWGFRVEFRGGLQRIPHALGIAIVERFQNARYFGEPAHGMGELDMGIHVFRIESHGFFSVADCFGIQLFKFFFGALKITMRGE